MLFVFSVCVEGDGLVNKYFLYIFVLFFFCIKRLMYLIIFGVSNIVIFFFCLFLSLI